VLDEKDKQSVLKGREAVDAYRQAHAALHSQPWHKGIPEEHTPLLDKMLSELSKHGFDKLEGFFGTSDELNVEELGFSSMEDFRDNASAADREAFEGMWH
jgi:hypothetical protein